MSASPNAQRIGASAGAGFEGAISETAFDELQP